MVKQEPARRNSSSATHVASAEIPFGASSSSAGRLTKKVTLTDTELLRGVTMSTVMKGFGAVLQDSEGGPEGYKSSQYTPSITSFLSHNWTMGRGEKFLALALHYNAGYAVAAAWAAGALSAVLALLGYLPVVKTEGAPLSLNAWFFGHIIFFLVLIYGHQFRHLCGLDPPTLFLDKLCIHQGDKELQQQGIRNLAGFLHASESMVVIYGSDYLHRLWTVYEMASFLLIHQEVSRIHVVPAYWAKCCILQVVCLCAATGLFYGLYWLTQVFGLSSKYWLPVYGTAVIVWGTYTIGTIKSWNGRSGQIQKTIAKFSIRHAVCTHEEDRTLVEQNIFEFLQVLGWVEELEDKQTALDRFDEAVRIVLPSVFQLSFGKQDLSYRTIVVAMMGMGLTAFDRFGAGVKDESKPMDIGRRVLYNLLVVFAIAPMGVELSNRILRGQLDTAGWAKYIASFVPGFSIFVVFAVLAQSHDREVPGGYKLKFFMVLVLGIGLCLCTFVLYSRRASAQLQTLQQRVDVLGSRVSDPLALPAPGSVDWGGSHWFVEQEPVAAAPKDGAPVPASKNRDFSRWRNRHLDPELCTDAVASAVVSV